MDFNDGSQYREVVDFAAYMATRDLYCGRAASARAGVPYVDTAFQRQREGLAEIRGLCWYQFVYLNAGTPEQQADFFVDECLGGFLYGNEMVMIDTEVGGGFTKDNVQEWTRRWLEIVENRLETRAWVYVPGALAPGLPRSFTGDRLVMAPRYSGSEKRGAEPTWPWDIHQFTDRGSFPGIREENGDLNYTELTTEEMLARCNPSGITTPCGS